MTVAASPLLLAGCIVPSPSPGLGGRLSAVAALSKSNAWAVGAWFDANTAHDLIEHWDGTAWHVVTLPRPTGTGLADVTAISASNVWAVGGGRTLHYDGRSWQSSPDPVGLSLIHVSSGADGALRSIASSTITQKLTILQWASFGWRTMAAPALPRSHRSCDGNLGNLDLAVLNARDIWVVGNVYGFGNNAATACAYTAHWNGVGWKQVPTPALPNNVTLSAVSARTARDVWAVGTSSFTFAPTGRLVNRSIALHWNGAQWTSMPSVDSSGWGDAMTDVDATSGGVWAVGTEEREGGVETVAVIKKWSGTRFVDQPVQRITIKGLNDLSFMQLSGVTVRDGVVVSVGDYVPRDGKDVTLVDRRNAG